MKVPGMSYQPPLIGSKQLLNFHATSSPGTMGGWIAIAALAFVLGAAVLEWRRARALHAGPVEANRPLRVSA